jgi:hypothetical protein
MSGDFQDAFSSELQYGVPLHISRQPNLERDCKDQLPAWAFAELKKQVNVSTDRK